MQGIEHNCARCGKLFVGKPVARYCSDTCRWRDRSAERYAAQKAEQEGAVPKPKREKDPVRQAMGRSNRRKGAVAEREVCHLVERHTGDKVCRNLSQTRDAGGDVIWGPFYLEVKYQRTIAMPAWQRQAVQSARDEGERIPAVVYRQPNEKYWVSMPFEEFLQLFQGLRVAAGIARPAPPVAQGEAEDENPPQDTPQT